MLKRSLAAFALLVAVAPAYAASECKDLREFTRDEAAAVGAKYVDSFTFRRDLRGDNVLLLFKDTIEQGTPPKHWLFLNRPSPDAGGFCAMGRGETFTYHDDKPEKLYAGDYGLPGSQRPQCATSSPGISAPDVLRAYANRTLGEDMVFDASAPGAGGFQFAIAQDQNWIIIRDNADVPETSCLYDQGPDVFMRFNNTIPAP